MAFQERTYTVKLEAMDGCESNVFFIRIKFRGNDFNTSMVMYDPSFHISKLFRTCR